MKAFAPNPAAARDRRRAVVAAAQDFDFRPPASATDPALPAALRDLAERMLPVYQENDPDRYLSNLAALQMVGRRPGVGVRDAPVVARAAAATRRAHAGRSRDRLRHLHRARAIETQVRTPFANAYAQAFREPSNRSTTSTRTCSRGSLHDADRSRCRKACSARSTSAAARPGSRSNEALDLIWAWFAFEAYRSFGAVVRPLLAAEDARRYVIDEDVAIPVSKTAHGQRDGGPSARSCRSKLPTMLEFALDTRVAIRARRRRTATSSVLARARGLRDKIRSAALHSSRKATTRAP